MAVSLRHSLFCIVDANGVPIIGAKFNVYAAQTTTPLTLYSDSDLQNVADNPVITDSAGVLPLRYIATASYKITATTSAGAALTRYSGDNIDPGVAVGSGALPVANGGTGATTAGAARTNLGAAADSTVTSIASDVTTLQAQIVDLQSLRWGQCQLAKSGSNLVLSPFNGNKLTINSVACEVPDAGVSLAPGSVPTGNLEYIYAYMNSTTMTLEFSATAPAVQAETGVKIKNGDATRTLVGMAYATAGPVWVDSAAQRYVRSWFNDPGISLLGSLSADRTTTSTSYQEVNSEIRTEFLIWSGEVLQVVGTGSLANDANAVTFTSVGIDGITAEDVAVKTNVGANVYSGFSLPLMKASLSEGYHYATLLGKCVSGTNTYIGNATAGLRCTLKGYAKR